MPKYVDGYVLPVPKKNLPAYRRMAAKAGKIWREHGALQFFECAGDDLAASFCVPFPKQMRTKPGETVMFSFIIFKSRADRDRVNKKVMADPRLTAMMDPKNTPFDARRMVYGGFSAIVEA